MTDITPTTDGGLLRKRLLKPLGWSLLAAVILYTGSAVLGDFKAIGDAALRLGVGGWGLILGLSLVNYGLRFVRWQWYLGRLGCEVPVGLSLAYYLGGFAFTTTPGKAGEVIRSFYLKRHGVTYAQSLAAFFSERLLDLLAVFCLALAAIWVFPDYRWLAAVVPVLLVILLPLLHSDRLGRMLEQRAARVSASGLRRIMSRGSDLIRASAELLKARPMYVGLAIGIPAWAAEGVALQVILAALDVEMAWSLAIGIYALSVLGGALSFIPGGLGSTEALMVALLTLAGSPLPEAFAATLICRLATLWFAVALGGLVLAALELGGRPGGRAFG